MARTLRLAAIVCAGLLAASCTLTKLVYRNAAFAYSNATPALTWLVDDYVDLSSAQRDFVRERLSRAFAWHRSDELPEYRRFLEQVLRQADDNITVDEARTDYRELRARYTRLLERVLPDVADFLIQLDPDQAVQMERKFAEDNKKTLTEATRGSAAERFERRLKRTYDHIEEFTGTLNDAQREMLVRHMGSLEDPYQERLAERRYRQAQILALVRGKPSHDEAIGVLRRLLLEPETWRSAQYTAKLRVREEQLFEMVAGLSATLNAGQRAHFQKRVRGFMGDIAGLTAAN